MTALKFKFLSYLIAITGLQPVSRTCGTNRVRDFLGYLLPSSHTLPLTMVKRARLYRSSFHSIRAYLTAVDNSHVLGARNEQNIILHKLGLILNLRTPITIIMHQDSRASIYR